MSASLQTIALVFIPSSTYMMLKGGSIVTTLIFSKYLLDIYVQKRQIVGCGLAILGLLLVGVGEIYIGDSSNATEEGQVSFQHIFRRKV